MSEEYGQEIENTTHNKRYSVWEKTGLVVFAAGILFLVVSATGSARENPVFYFLASLGSVTAGALIFILAQGLENSAGIKNNNIFFNSVTARGTWAYILGIVITGFYVLLYWFPETLTNWIRLTDPLTMLITGVALVGLTYAEGGEPDNAKITVKFAVLIGILALVLVNRKREQISTAVWAAIGGLTILNVVLAVFW